MAEAIKPSPVKLIIGAIFASEGILIKARQRLERKFGPVDFQSPAIPFDFTDYYRQEMGPNLTRRFFSFQRLIRPEELAGIKLYTNRLEKQFSPGGNKLFRTINLDPGYMSQAKLVLASCKNYYHRIYLGKSVFAEITLYFQDGAFKFHPWTYPDYKSASYIKSFTTIREIYRKQLS